MTQEKKPRKAKASAPRAPEALSTEISKMTRLLAFAARWIGVKEIGGDNKGPEVEEFQKAVDSKAQGEAWCMCFVQFCLKAVGPHDLPLSESCLTVWNRADRALRLDAPQPGCLMIWRHAGTDQGHVGIVSAVNGPDEVMTIEGNTGPGHDVQREGDGVYERTRSTRDTATMQVLGWLKPWRNEA